MTSPSFGEALLEKHGRGKLASARKEEFSADLKKELINSSVGVASIPGDVLDKEIARFLDFGYASENNLDRFKRRVLRLPPEKERSIPHDAASQRSNISEAYSQPNGRVGRRGSDTPIVAGLRFDTVSESSRQGLEVSSARQGTTPDKEVQPSPLSARSALSSRNGDGCKWSTVAKLNALRECKEAEEKKAAVKQKKEQLKAFLDEQVQAKSALSKSKFEETRQLRAQADFDHQRLQEEEQEKKNTFKQKVAVLKNDRQEQVVMAQMARELERKERLEAGKKLANEANQALELEQQKVLEKKQQEKVIQQKLINEWHDEQEEVQEKQRVQKIAERQAVLKLQEELRKEEDQKQKELQKALAERDEMFKSLANADAEARQKKKFMREARIQQENKELELVWKANADAAEKDRQKALKARADKIQNVEFLCQQMTEHQDKKALVAEQKKEMAANAKIEIDRFKEEEREKSSARMARNVQHRIELEQQISSRVKVPPRVREDLMSTSEACINKKLVGEAGQFGLY